MPKVTWPQDLQLQLWQVLRVLCPLRKQNTSTCSQGTQSLASNQHRDVHKNKSRPWAHPQAPPCLFPCMSAGDHLPSRVPGRITRRGCTPNAPSRAQHPAGASPRLETELLSSCSSAISLLTSLSTHTPLAQAAPGTCHVQGLPQGSRGWEGGGVGGLQSASAAAGPALLAATGHEEHNREHGTGRAHETEASCSCFWRQPREQSSSRGAPEDPQAPPQPPIQSNASEALHSGPFSLCGKWEFSERGCDLQLPAPDCAIPIQVPAPAEAMAADTGR